MQITIATEADIDAILKLQTQIYRTEKIADGAKSTLEKQLADETCDVLVGKDDQENIISTAVIYYIEVPVRSRPYAFLEGLVVDESTRGQGVGTIMFEKITELARTKNCYKILFTSATDRTDAHKLYEKLGFKKWGLEFRMDL
jgi:GNAT superfamily N-acetyltransferase